MRVFVDGAPAYSWPVSTARKGFVTPRGRFRVGRMAPSRRSRKYQGSPMPHAMFSRGSYAIPGTTATRSLGRRTSHGCMRLATGHAATLFRLTLLGRPGGDRRLKRNGPAPFRAPGRFLRVSTVA
ncbi:hypothetical protein FMGBMHLM_3619 [Methylobacterium aerolatum]|nr:hypothetical protein FMGBMHLM_3619 [Methylobacterium aerolatum]